jgi:hypothetical protein
MWHNWQTKPTAQRDAMTEDDAKHEARRLTERTGRIHIPVYTCDGWEVQHVETAVYTEQAN